MWRGEPENTQIYFTIKNLTTHNVKLKVFNAYLSYVFEDTTFLITPNSAILYEIIDRPPYRPFGAGGDSAYMVFDNVKQIIYRRDDGQTRNILDINSHTGGQVTEYYYKYQYEITDEDYANAVEIK
jgi:hypothetical protein